MKSEWLYEQFLGKGKGMRQLSKILEYVKEHGSITSLEATRDLFIMSFTKRMSALRREPNYEVSQEWEINGHTRSLRYTIKEVENEKAN